MFTDDDRLYLRKQKAFKNQNCVIDVRPLCAAEGDGCINIYGIYLVTEDATTLIRYEGVDGAVLGEEAPIVLTSCTCDCEDSLVPPEEEPE